jgi:hypothetical protein
MKRHKYGAIAKTIDGHRFPSLAEARRYEQLSMMCKGGIIFGLRLQPKFAIVVNGQHICNVIPDFAYFEDGQYVVEDSKAGVRTAMHSLKAKLLKATHNITIRETGKSSKRVLPRRAKAA